MNLKFDLTNVNNVISGAADFRQGLLWKYEQDLHQIFVQQAMLQDMIVAPHE